MKKKIAMLIVALIASTHVSAQEKCDYAAMQAEMKRLDEWKSNILKEGQDKIKAIRDSKKEKEDVVKKLTSSGMLSTWQENREILEKEQYITRKTRDIEAAVRWLMIRRETVATQEELSEIDAKMSALGKEYAELSKQKTEGSRTAKAHMEKVKKTIEDEQRLIESMNIELEKEKNRMSGVEQAYEKRRHELLNICG